MEKEKVNIAEFAGSTKTLALLQSVTPLCSLICGIVLTYMSPHPVITLTAILLTPVVGITLLRYGNKHGRFMGWPICVINGLILCVTCLYAGKHSPTFILASNHMLYVTASFRGVSKLVNYILGYLFIIVGSLLAPVDHMVILQGLLYISLYLLVLNRALSFLIVQGNEISTTKNALSAEKDKTEHLLLNILPFAVAERLKEDKSILADSYESVTVLFADIVGFTQLSKDLPPNEIVTFLNDIFSKYDQLAEDYGLEKIKTIGDAYMMAGGVPSATNDHAIKVCNAALKMQEIAYNTRMPNNDRLQMRIGISTGPVTAGVIGTKKFIYDLWGDTVNTASRMESHSEAGRIHITDEVYLAVKHEFTCLARAPINIKGKGLMSTHFLVEKHN